MSYALPAPTTRQLHLLSSLLPRTLSAEFPATDLNPTIAGRCVENGWLERRRLRRERKSVYRFTPEGIAVVTGRRA